MRKVAPATLVLSVALSTSAAFAQQKMGDMKDMDMPQTPAASAQATHSATGEVL
jgi:Cu(I)/Ag(I) efflux system protein CusF